MPKETILVIDDDPTMLDLVSYILNQAGWQVYTATDGLAGLQQLQIHQPDLVILDIMMPDMDGWELCQQIRNYSNVPIIMLTALDQDSHIIRGLRESGADDYVVKPFFSRDVLTARVKALLRRAALSAKPQKAQLYKDGHLTIDLRQHRVLVRGEAVKLTDTEYRLLVFMLQHANRVLSFGQILEGVWGTPYQDSAEYIHVYISRLRQKLEVDPKNPRYWVTVHGIGYRFQTPVQP